MSPPFEYRPLQEESEEAFVQRLDAQCFLGTTANAERYFNQIGANNFRVLCQGTQPIGGLSILPMGQWFGGQRVPMAGIASVGILPEHRGDGGAIALMRATIQELYERDLPISVLYPATQRLYRKALYEQGGTYCGWEIRVDQIQISERSLPLNSISPDIETLKPIYQRYAARHNGPVDRHRSIWMQKVDPGLIAPESAPEIYAYQVGVAPNPEGYIVFSQKREDGQGVLTIRDWTAVTVEAARSLWAFLAGHRSQVDIIRWRGGVVDPMLPLLPEQSARMTFAERWMLRILNLPLALEARGYAAGVSGELHLKIRDEDIATNTGAWILTVTGGQGTVTPGGRGDLNLSIQAMASLYTGLMTPYELRWIGWLDGSDESVAIATQLFAGPSPWMPDFF